jgi:outer membrane protein
MTSKLLSGAAALLMLSAVQANAQSTKKSASAAAATASAAQPALVHGPVIAGVCVFSNEGALATSLVGKAAAARLQQLRAQVAAELSGEQTSLQEDIKAFQAKRASLTQDQIQAESQPLEQRYQALNQKGGQRERELQATLSKARGRIDQAIEPIVKTIYQDRHCSLLLNGEAVMAVNPAMDLTPAVVERLNASMSTITFDREILPAQQQ